MFQKPQKEREQDQKMISYFMEMVKTEDYINMGFGRPFEVALRTNQTDQSVPSHSLPQGLMQVNKGDSIIDNQYTLHRINAIPPKQKDFQEIKKQHMDNYLSLLKKYIPQGISEESHFSHSTYRIQQSSIQQQKQEIQLGICITMTGEDTNQLKKTLNPLFQNIDSLTSSGLQPDNIFVVVIIDGMANMDKSLHQYFAYFQRINKSYLEKDVLKLQRLYKQIRQHRITKDMAFLSRFYFDADQFDQRQQRKPQSVHQKYLDVLHHKKQIQKILYGKQTIQRLEDGEERRLNNGVEQQQDQSAIIKELNQALQACNLYLSTRQELSYVSAYKLPTNAFSSDLRKNTHLNFGQSYKQPLMENKKKHNKGQINLIKYINLLFCIKYKQAGKISSHNWFFNGFCKQLNPKYSIMIDIGTTPSSNSIYKMYVRLKTDQNVGGVCAYLKKVQQKSDSARLEDVDCVSKNFTKLFQIRKTDRIQNHLSYLIDKSFESVCGFTHSLSMSFSAYRMQTLWSAGENGSLLKDYFRQISQKTISNKIIPSIFTTGEIIQRVLLPKIFYKNVEEDSQEQMLYNENIYMTLDRILCLGIQKNGKSIAFMPDVQAQIKSTRMVNSLMNKKKQEMNGEYYSTQKVRRQINNPNHNLSCGIKFQLSHFNLSGWLQYFSLSILLFIFNISFTILWNQIFTAKDQKQKLVNVEIIKFICSLIICIYILLIGAILLFSLHLDHNHKKFKFFVYLTATVLGILSLFNFSMSIVETIQIFLGEDKYLKGEQNGLPYMPQILQISKTLFKLSIGSIFAIITIPCLFYTFLYAKCDRIYDLFTGILSLIFYLPTYSIIFPIYSKCCLDKFSLNSAHIHQKLAQSWKVIKMIHIAKYFIWNTIVVCILLLVNDSIKFCILTFILVLFALLKLLKVLLATIYLLYYRCFKTIEIYKAGEELLVNTYRINQIIRRFEGYFRIKIREGLVQSSRRINYTPEYIVRFHQNF